MIDAPHTGHDRPGAVRTRQPGRGHPTGVARRNRQRIAVLTGATTGGATQMGNVAVPAAPTPAPSNKRRRPTGSPPLSWPALLYHESRFEPNVVSSAGAEGIAQFMPATAAGMGIDPTNPTQSIEGAAQLLGSYTRQFGSYADALAAYDAGSSAVERYGGIPPYAETQAYVPAVLSLAGLSGQSGDGDDMSAAGTVVATSAEGAGDMPSSAAVRAGTRPRTERQPFSEVLSLSAPDLPGSCQLLPVAVAVSGGPDDGTWPDRHGGGAHPRGAPAGLGRLLRGAGSPAGLVPRVRGSAPTRSATGSLAPAPPTGRRSGSPLPAPPGAEDETAVEATGPESSVRLSGYRRRSSCRTPPAAVAGRPGRFATGRRRVGHADDRRPKRATTNRRRPPKTHEDGPTLSRRRGLADAAARTPRAPGRTRTCPGSDAAAGRTTRGDGAWGARPGARPGGSRRTDRIDRPARPVRCAFS